MSDVPNFCIKCGALDTDWARDGCSNPLWHIPNFTEPLPESEVTEEE